MPGLLKVNGCLARVNGPQSQGQRPDYSRSTKGRTARQEEETSRAQARGLFGTLDSRIFFFSFIRDKLCSSSERVSPDLDDATMKRLLHEAEEHRFYPRS